MLTLISATPSPYARKNRILMLEKGIPFSLRTEIPWHSNTETPKFNPLEKLPILIFDDGRPPIYESWLIQEYIVQKYRGVGPDLVPESIDDQLLVRQIQVLADGACDAMGLVFWENGRGELKSQEWHDRQMRKVNGAIKAANELVKKSKGSFLVGGEYSVADIALGSILGGFDVVETKYGIIHWKEEYPDLRKYWEMLESRESFKATKPVMFEITEKVV